MLEENQSLAAVIENARRRGWVRDDVSPLTLAVWTRGQILGRYVLKMDSTRYDGEEWTKFAITAIEEAMFVSTNKLNP